MFELPKIPWKGRMKVAVSGTVFALISPMVGLRSDPSGDDSEAFLSHLA